MGDNEYTLEKSRVKNSDGYPPLVKAAEDGEIDEVRKWLLVNGIDVNIQKKNDSFGTFDDGLLF